MLLLLLNILQHRDKKNIEENNYNGNKCLRNINIIFNRINVFFLNLDKVFISYSTTFNNF